MTTTRRTIPALMATLTVAALRDVRDEATRAADATADHGTDDGPWRALCSTIGAAAARELDQRRARLDQRRPSLDREVA
jgi:hypothetical protein